MGDVEDMLAAARKEAFHPVSAFGTTPEVARMLFQRIDALEEEIAGLRAASDRDCRWQNALVEAIPALAYKPQVTEWVPYLSGLDRRARAAEAIADLPLNLRRCAAKIERDLRQEFSDRATIRAMVAGSIPQMVAFWANPERFGIMLRVAAERAAATI